ncbi:type II toxin-antitoxin system prevent-host-death family antitoxin [Corynebacterium nasicanis]
MSSRKFNQDLSRAKRAARKSPVTITDRGRPDLVLMTYEEFRRLQRGVTSLRGSLVIMSSDTVDFDPVKFRGSPRTDSGHTPHT